MADEEAAALRAQIAALSGAIDQRRSGPSNYGAEGLRGRERGRGRGGRGRGAPTPSRNRTLVLSTEPGFSSLSRFSPSSTLAPSETSADGYSGGWVKRKTTHNMSLVSSSSFEKTEPARLAALEASRKAGKAQASPFKEGAGGDMNSSDRGKIGDLKPSQKLKPKPKPAIRRGDNMGEVIIDGVTFEFDETGTKLVKKAARPRSPSPVPSHMSPSNSDVAKADDRQPSTPLKTSVNGQAFVRTKRGNLISVELLAKRKEEKQNAQKLKRLDSIGRQLASVQRARNGSRTSNQTMGARWSSRATKRGLCAFFNKTGQCKRGLSCPYTHDASKIAICPGVLRSSGCTQAPGSCLLSHDIRPERVPHCVHYLRTAACRNGEACPYTHPSPTSRQAINVRADNICPEFTKVGWCDGGRECKKRHTWDCPAFVRSGQCQTKGCRLLHVIRAESLGNRKKGLQDEEEEGLQDADLFVRDDSAFVRADDDGHGEDQEEEEEEEEEGDSEDAEEKEEEKEEEEEEEEKKEDAAGEEDSIRGKDSEAPMKRKRQDEQIDFSSTRQKRKTAKDFIGQQDFISFTEADDDGDDDGDIDCSIKEEGPDGSVHSDSDDGAGGDM